MTDVILKDQFDYEIYFSHQNDTRPFNRGGVKNIGFIKKSFSHIQSNILIPATIPQSSYASDQPSSLLLGSF